MTPTEDYQRQIEYWKEAARQAEDEATFLRGQYNEAEEKRGRAEQQLAALREENARLKAGMRATVPRPGAPTKPTGDHYLDAKAIHRLSAEVERLRDIISPGEAAVYEEGMATLTRERDEAEAKFKKWSGTDVPALNVALAEARAEVDRLKGLFVSTCESRDAWIKQCDKATDEVSRLKRGYDEYTGQLDPAKILSALHVAERERDEARALIPEDVMFRSQEIAAENEVLRAEVSRLEGLILEGIEGWASPSMDFKGQKKFRLLCDEADRIRAQREEGR